MAKLRKFSAYRRLERPYTRVSKYRKKSYVRANPNTLVVKFDMGDASAKYDYRIDLISKADLQIRHNALESARMFTNRHIEKALGKKGYHLKIRVFPHHILRENPLASGAGADRLSTGMKQSFGKPVGKAAQIRKAQKLISLSVQKSHLDLAKKILKTTATKLPCSCRVEETKLSA